MKTQFWILILAAVMFTGVVMPLHAQLVADGATTTLNNVANTITGEVTVGTNRPFTLLVRSDNVLLTNSAKGAPLSSHQGGAVSFFLSLERPHKPTFSFFASASSAWSRGRCADAFSPEGRLGRTPLGLGQSFAHQKLVQRVRAGQH